MEPSRGHPRKPPEPPAPQPPPPAGEPAPGPPGAGWPDLSGPAPPPPGATPAPAAGTAELAGQLWQIAAALQQVLNQLVDLCARLAGKE